MRTEKDNPQFKNPDEKFEVDSDTAERCFGGRHKTESRKWLIRDASAKLPWEPPVSTMRDTFPWPVEREVRTNIGKRRANIEKNFIEEVTAQLMEESKQPPPIEKYCTTYDVTYQMEGFKPSPTVYGNTPELYEKYPLYSSAPLSYWQFLYENRNGKPGYAALADVKQPFKRRSIISKPVNEILDDTLL